ncbi:MAG: VanZ family protein [Sedimentisphaerales bacterium]|nr:VanZ family protein [Sedimentisphaerales bacterium]
MALTRRRKLAIASLAVYWPVLFILAHIPIPGVVRKAGVSDKGLHFLAYLTLVFLFWIATNPERKVLWRRSAVWWALLIVVLYGITDELLQGVVGRSCDVRDLAADLAGAVTGLVLLTIFSFWPAALIVGGALIFGIANIARVKPSDIMPIGNAAFYLLSYAIFTLVWIRCMRRFATIKAPKPRWVITASALPAALLGAVKAYSVITGRGLGIQDVILAIMGIAAGVGIVWWTAIVRRRAARKNPSI